MVKAKRSGEHCSGQMVRKEKQFGGLKKLDELDAKLDEISFYKDVLDFRTEVIQSDKQLREFRRQAAAEGDEGDPDYMNFMLHIISKGESAAIDKNRKEYDKKRKEYDDASDNDYSGEDNNDSQYEGFLKCLTEHKKSYLLKSEKDGSPDVLKYEGGVHSTEECNPEPRRKLRSAMNHSVGPSSQMPRLGNQYKHNSLSPETMNMTGRITRSKNKIKNVEATKSTANELVPCFNHLICRTPRVEDKEKAIEKCDPGPRTRLRSGMRQRTGSSSQLSGSSNQCKHDLQSRDETGTGRKLRNKAMDEKVQEALADQTVPDPDYANFCRNAQVINGSYVYVEEGATVVYEKDEQLKEEHDDESYSDVEIIDHDTFHNAVNLYPSKAVSTKGVHDMNKTSEFREQLINLLRKPYCRKEHENLLHDVELRKPIEKHIELRNGRERSGSKHIDGKSYLDHYPDFERKLLLRRGDRVKCLNLLRGFFFWLQKSEQHGSFRPWDNGDALQRSQGYSMARGLADKF